MLVIVNICTQKWKPNHQRTAFMHLSQNWIGFWWGALHGTREPTHYLFTSLQERENERDNTKKDKFLWWILQGWKWWMFKVMNKKKKITYLFVDLVINALKLVKGSFKVRKYRFLCENIQYNNYNNIYYHISNKIIRNQLIFSP